MNEGISYSFLLNTVIIFIFVCVAIISGIFSYYRAFRANTIIVGEIEKYEGYNCLSEQSIVKKLRNVSYSVPFSVTCKNSFGEPCITDDEQNYAVVAYNLDFSEGEYIGSDKYSSMNSKSSCTNDNPINCENTKKYQYGVYTYMYVNLPVVSSLLKIPIYTKTKTMYEYRNLYKAHYTNAADDIGVDNFYDSRFLPSGYSGGVMSGFSVIGPAAYTYDFATEMLKTSHSDEKDGIVFTSTYNSRDSIKYSGFSTYDVKNGYNLGCGYKIDYSKN